MSGETLEEGQEVAETNEGQPVTVTLTQAERTLIIEALDDLAGYNRGISSDPREMTNEERENPELLQPAKDKIKSAEALISKIQSQ